MSLTIQVTNEQLTALIAQIGKSSPDNEKILTDFFAEHQQQKKKRGRPAKKKSLDAEDPAKKEDSDAEAPAEEVPKKKRGRPAKKKSPDAEAPVKKEDSDAEAPAEVVPKKNRVAREEVDSEFWGNLDERDFQTYNFEDDKSSKFWKFCQDGNKVLICYGKCGKTGTLQQKTFESEEAVSKFLFKETASKEKKGYTLV